MAGFLGLVTFCMSSVRTMALHLVTFVMQQRMCPVVARGRPHETSLGLATGVDSQVLGGVFNGGFLSEWLGR